VNSNTKNFFAASLLFFNHDVHDEHDEWLPPRHDAKRRYQAQSVLIGVVRRGKIKPEQRSCENVNITSYYSLLKAEKSVPIRSIRFIRFPIMLLW